MGEKARIENKIYYSPLKTDQSYLENTAQNLLLNIIIMGYNKHKQRSQLFVLVFM